MVECCYSKLKADTEIAVKPGLNNQHNLVFTPLKTGWKHADDTLAYFIGLGSLWQPFFFASEQCFSQIFTSKEHCRSLAPSLGPTSQRYTFLSCINMSQQSLKK